MIAAPFIRFNPIFPLHRAGSLSASPFLFIMAVSIDIPTSEPSQITAGDTWTWKKSLSDFLASDSWVLTYALVKDGKIIELTASADGDDHLIEEVPTDTAKHDPGIYHYQAYVTKSSERYQVGTGTIEVLPDFAESAGYDNRSHAKKTLDAIEAVIEGKATRDQLAHSIGGRSLSRYSWTELIEARDRYRAEYYAEERKAGRKSSKVKVKFTSWA